MARSSARSLWAKKLSGQPTSGGKPGGAPGGAPVTGGVSNTHVLGERFFGVVLGIDPSLRGTGLSVLRVERGGVFELLFSRTVRVPATYTSVHCLGAIAGAVSELLDRFPVQHVAIEETIYVQNFRTAQILGTARGAAIATPAMRAVPVFEYAPLRIKQSITGFGRASKEQVAGQVKALLRLDTQLPFDESDAAAVALCHALTHRD